MTYDSVFRPDLFKDRVAIVTGGGSGIGRCIAHELAHLGARVVIASRDESKLERVREEIEAADGLVDANPCNIRREEDVQRLVRETRERHGRIDYLVNNAGGQFVSPVEHISLKGWNAVIETNLTGTFLLSKEVVNEGFGEAGGAIVNIIADMARGMPMMAHSGAARAGVENLTKSCAVEWAPKGVRVNAVAPGLILSSGFDQYPEPVQEVLYALPPEIPARRFGTEGEISSAVVFLLSPGAQYVTGTTISVDGASSLKRLIFPLPDREPWPEYVGFTAAAPDPAQLAGKPRNSG